MSKLAAALAWAARGFAVFPLQVNTREPAHATDWNELATRDPAMIRAMWTDPVLGTERDYNIGCAATDYVIIDIDVKKGKNGIDDYAKMGGHYDTLVVQTTSGGYHCYFQGPDSSNAPLSDAVDVRSHRGYVVAPGSVIDGNTYRVVNERDMAWVPETIERRLVPPHVRSEASQAQEVDTPAAIQAAINFLITAPPAVEGMRGDEVTFITAARLVREMALSPTIAWQLLMEHWNPRCEPPWDGEELYRKVENAFRYGSADEGRLSPETLFGGVVDMLTPPPSVFAQIPSWGNAIVPSSIRPRNWLVDRMLMFKAVTVLLASGSAGKSTFSLALAAHMAVGKPFAGHKCKTACKSIIYNGEDDVEEQSRRLNAICIAYQLDYATVRANILLLSARELKLQLVVREGSRAVRNDTLIAHLTEKCKEDGVGLLVLDPLVKIHQCDENDNVSMDVVMETLTDLAYNSDIAILVLHHTGKASDQKQEQRIGNPEISRGASAVINASRVAYTLLNASRQDAEDYGFADNERHMWVRLDDAKMNMALAGETATWFHKEGVKIISNDVVGVLSHREVMKSRNHIRDRIATLLITTMEGNGNGSLTFAQAISVVKASEPLWANKTDTDVRRGLEGLLHNAVEISGRTIQIVRDEKNPDKATVILR